MKERERGESETEKEREKIVDRKRVREGKMADEAGTDQVEEDFSVWKKNTPFLYDLMISNPLEWPSLTVHWVPSTPNPYAADPYFGVHKLILGTHTSGEDHDYLMVADVLIPTPGAEPGLGGSNQDPILPKVTLTLWRFLNLDDLRSSCSVHTMCSIKLLAEMISYMNMINEFSFLKNEILNLCMFI